jgi:flagellar biosynthesis GTPase FlhF
MSAFRLSCPSSWGTTAEFSQAVEAEAVAEEALQAEKETKAAETAAAEKEDEKEAEKEKEKEEEKTEEKEKEEKEDETEEEGKDEEEEEVEQSAAAVAQEQPKKRARLDIEEVVFGGECGGDAAELTGGGQWIRRSWTIRSSEGVFSGDHWPVRLSAKGRSGVGISISGGYLQFRRQDGTQVAFHRQLLHDMWQVEPDPRRHVHHRNDSRLDNTLANLELVDERAHGRLHGQQGGRRSRGGGRPSRMR